MWIHITPSGVFEVIGIGAVVAIVLGVIAVLLWFHD